MVLQLFLRLPDGGLRACQALPNDSVASICSSDGVEHAYDPAQVRTVTQEGSGRGGRHPALPDAPPAHSCSFSLNCSVLCAAGAR